MRKKEIIHRALSLFLACVIFFGTIFSSGNLFAEGVDRVNTKITKFEIKDENGNPIPPGHVHGYYNKFRLEMDWDASIYGKTLKAGDYFIVTLPKQFKFPTEGPTVDFPLYAPDGHTVIANAHVNSNGADGGGTVKVTFTNYVVNRENIKGNLFLEATLAHKNINAGVPNTIVVSINGVQTSVTINIGKKPELNNEVFAKWGAKVSGKETEAQWTLRINHKKGHFSNVVIKDELFVDSGNLPPSIHYLKDTFILKEVEMDKYGSITNIKQTYNYEKLKKHIKFLDNDTKFEFNLSAMLGNTSGKQFSMEYKSTYIPQLKLRNKATFISTEDTIAVRSYWMNSQAGGGGQGDLNQKIKIIKIDEEDNTKKLANAKFLITKVADGSTFELTTDSNGEAVSPKLDPGKYKIKEIGAPTGYIPDGKEHDLTIAGGEALFYTVKNKRSKVKINVEKAWQDANDQDGKRPKEITVKLLADDVETDKQLTLKASEGWKGSFENLDEYKDGKKIKYTIKELSVGEGYTSVISGSSEDGFKVTNAREPEKVNISGEKTWDDANNQDGKRPTKITVKLMKKVEGGQLVEAQRQEVTKGADDKWKYEFKNLPKYENGKEITYSIDEEEVKGYKKTIDGTNIKNSYTPGKVSIKVTKTWEDKDNQDGKRPASVTIKLFANGVETGDKLTLTKENGWKGSFDNLDEYKDGKKIDYSIEEEDVENGYKGFITQTSDTEFNVINKREPEKTFVEGSKTWDDKENQDGKRPKEIKINLLKNGTKIATKTVTKADDWKWKFEDLDKYENGEVINYTITEEQVEGYTTEVTGHNVKNSYTPGKTSVQVTKAWEDKNNQDGVRPASVTVKLLADGVETGDKLTLTEANNWTGSFTGLDEYKAGKKIEYTVKEETVGNGYESEITKTGENNFTVTNTREPEKTFVEGSKTWDDKENQDGKRPKEIKINLLKNGKVLETKTVTEKDGWKWKFENLDKYENGELINYTITEEKVEEYTTVVKGHDVINTHAPGKTSVQVTKAWEDKNNQDGVRPGIVTVRLIADGVETDKTVTLTEANNWTGSFTDLDEYKDGKKIVYTVKEENVGNGYTSVVTKTGENNFTVTNTREPEKTFVEGSKTWDDKDNQDGKRPIEITINLLKNGTKVATKKVTEKDGWKWKFENLDKYENGELINYTIVEEKVEGYTTEVEGHNVKNSYTPEKTSVQVTKAWKDNNDQDKKRPDSVTIELLADGKETGKKVVLTKDNNWTGSFTDLDEYKDGKKIVYTVKEEAVGNGYKSVITGNAKEGFVVTNVRTPKPRIPKTGAGSNSALYTVLLGLSGTALFSVFRRKRKEEI